MIAVVLALSLAASDASCAGLPADHLQAVEAQLAQDIELAEATAERFQQSHPDCAVAQLANALVVNHRLQQASGLSALLLSREYRGALEQVLQLDPANRRARVEQIEYHIYAPAIAGGSAARARELIVSFARDEPVEAARLSVLVERQSGGALDQLAALERYADVQPGNPEVIELAVRQVRLQRYAEAEARLLGLAAARDPGDQRSALAIPYLRGRLRVLGGFETEQAVALLRAYLDAGGPAGEAGLPSRAVVTFRLGEALLINGECRAARQQLDAARASGETIEGLDAVAQRLARCTEDRARTADSAIGRGE